MREIVLVYKQEIRAFLKSGKSSLFMLLFITLVWGVMISEKVDTIESATSFMWVLFFAMVAGAGQSTTSFVRERLSSTLEVLFLSGLERSSILYGKLLFTSSTTIAVGFGAFLVAFLVRTLFYQDSFFLANELIQGLVLFVSASILVSNCSALFSMALSNPRLIQFVNFTVLTLLSVIYTAVTYNSEGSLYLFAVVILGIATLFSRISLRLYKSERILQPLIY